MRQKIYLLGLVVLFCSMLLFPFLNTRVNWLVDVESFENRRAVSEPIPDIEHLDPFPARYDSFYNDHFNLRSQLIRYHNYFKILCFNKSPLPDKVIIGSGGWLFPAGEEFESYSGKNRLTQVELETFKKELEYRENYLAERNCAFYFLIAPCKASIYAEKIGFEYFRLTDQTWGQQLMAYLNANSRVKPVNVFDSLKNHKTAEPLYHPLDNHWNELGGLHASNALIGVMRQRFPGLQPLDPSNFNRKMEVISEGNMQAMLGNLSLFKEINLNLEPKQGYRAKEAPKKGYTPTFGFAYTWEYENVREIKNSKQPRLLIISDSFGAALFPFLSENFSRTVKIFDAWQYKLNEDIVNSEKPDAVVLVIDEPILRNFIKNIPKERLP